MEMNDILTRLQNGEPAETIANEMSDMLNKAVAENDKKTKEADREHQLAQEVADKINEYVAFKGIKSDPMTAESVIKIMDESIKTIEALNKFGDLFGDLFDTLGKTEKKSTAKKSKEPSADDVIAEFLKMFD